MNSAQGQDSEVARLLEQIRAEYEAAGRGLSGLAYGTSRHDFVTQKMNTMGRLHEELKAIVGETPAIALIVEQLNGCPEIGSSPVS
jgi:hypothetical protein